MYGIVYQIANDLRNSENWSYETAEMLAEYLVNDLELTDYNKFPFCYGEVDTIAICCSYGEYTDFESLYNDYVLNIDNECYDECELDDFWESNFDRSGRLEFLVEQDLYDDIPDDELREYLDGDITPYEALFEELDDVDTNVDKDEFFKQLQKKTTVLIDKDHDCYIIEPF